MRYINLWYVSMGYVSIWYVSMWLGTKVRLEPHVPVVDAQVGVEGSRLGTGSAHGHSKCIKQLFQVLPAADTREQETNTLFMI